MSILQRGTGPYSAQLVPGLVERFCATFGIPVLIKSGVAIVRTVVVASLEVAMLSLPYLAGEKPKTSPSAPRTSNWTRARQRTFTRC